MARRSLRGRTARRRLGREEKRLADERERLASAAPGGTPGRPLDIDSPAQVDVIAERTRCARCGEGMHLRQHTAATVDGARLRIAHLQCAACASPRRLYFRLAVPPLQ